MAPYDDSDTSNCSTSAPSSSGAWNWSSPCDGADNTPAGVVGTGTPLTPLLTTYPDELVHFAVAACVVFMLVGVPGNLITILALLRYSKVRTRRTFT